MITADRRPKTANRLLTGLLAVIFLLFPLAALAGSFPGLVVGVHDGDSITVKQLVKEDAHGFIYAGTQKVRLAHIDAPELSQPYGHAARQVLENLALNQRVTVEVVTGRDGGSLDRSIDRYGRLIGDVRLQDGKSLSRELVAAGYAWHYRQYTLRYEDRSVFEDLEKLETAAREARRGLWASSEPRTPWEWRKEKRGRGEGGKRGRGDAGTRASRGESGIRPEGG